MALASDIERLRDDTVTALDASHDYYAHTRSVWRLVQQSVAKQGRRATIRNQVTGNTIEQHELPGLAQEYVTGYLASATFQHFVSLFEGFVSDVLRLWLVKYPASLSAKEIKFSTVLGARDKDDIIRAVVDKQLVGLTYERLEKWFEYLEEIAKLGSPSPQEIERLAEIKATRDVLVHNRGLANATYVDKSAGQARFSEGEEIDVPQHYHRQSWQLIRSVVVEIADAAVKKLGK